MKNTEIAELLKTIADSCMALSNIYASDMKEEAKPKKAAKKEAPAPVKEEAPLNEEPVTEKAEEPKKYSKEEVRAMLAQKSKADDGIYRAAVKELVINFSEDGSLSGIPEEKYPELISAMEEMKNA